MNNLIKIFLIALFIISGAIFSSASIVDQTFNAFVTKTDITYIFAITRQPDGKFLVGGDFNTAGGLETNCLARFNADGTIDTGFRPQFTGRVLSIALQADGKILVGGQVRADHNGMTRRGIIRLLPDGSLDVSFMMNGIGSYGVKSVSLQPDGKIIVGGSFYEMNGESRLHLARINPDGTLDQSFNPVLSGYVETVLALPDGRIMVGGEFSTVNGQPSPWLARLNSDGSLDTSLGVSIDGKVYVFKLLADGKILIGGRFEEVNRTARRDLFRINPDGSLDTTFNYDFGNFRGYTYALDQQSDGKIIVGGNFSFLDYARRSLFRLNDDGSIDHVFPVSDGASGIEAIMVQPTGQIIVGGRQPGTYVFRRYEPDGTIDSTFQASAGHSAHVGGIAVLPNGKIYIGGDFTEVDGKPRGHIARLNANGTLDTSFNPLGTNGRVVDLAVQPDGKVILVGDFGLVNGVSIRRIARLNADGSYDTSFNVGAGANGFINRMVLQPDGKILIGGTFETYNNIERNSIARINPDGSLDTTFDCGSPGPNNAVTDIVPLSDGKILIGGWFGFINSTQAGSIARLNPDGTVDTSFNPGGVGTTGPGNVLRIVDAIDVQSDGKIVIGGSFFGYNNVTRNNLARLNANGTLDMSFAPNTQNVFELKIQQDGKIVIGGAFSTVNGTAQNKLARLNPNGSLDTTFDIGQGAGHSGDAVFKMAFQPNGNIIFGGRFRRFGGQDHIGIVRLKVSSAPLFSAPFDFDGDGRTDISIYRPSAGEWWVNRSSNSQTLAAQFGASADRPVAADYTGDGKTDIAFWRESTGEWFVLRSEDSSFYAFPFGSAGDIPAPGDFDADGRMDAAVFRPSTGVWYILRSSDGGVTTEPFGADGDRPVVADYDGDGKTDIAVYRPSSGEWWIRKSTGGISAVQFGATGDRPTPADFTGDGKTDVAFWRPSTGFWYILRSEDNSFYAFPFGANGDIPVAGDYDGDGRADAAVFRPSNATWYLQQTTTGFMAVGFGVPTDLPVPNAFAR